MKYLFFVQSDGRGHLTQALVLKEKLDRRGHQVVGVIIGTHPNYELPAYFREQIGVEIFFVDSPTFVVDKNNQGIKMFNSILSSLARLPRYLKAIRHIKKIVKELRPDALINFYEPLAGLYRRLSRHRCPLFCIGHQYFAEHPTFLLTATNRLVRRSFLLYNRLTAPSGTVKIALSFTKEPDRPEKNLFVVPPLVRKTIKTRATTNGDFLMIYLLNYGYGEEIMNLSRQHPEIKIHAFWDRPGAEETHSGDNLIFYQLSGERFIDNLANCGLYAATAGFDSVAEAAYLQKPIFLVPTKNHFEQKSNAADAGRAGLADTAENFDSALLNKIKKSPTNAQVDSKIFDSKLKTQSPDAKRVFKDWVDKYDDKIIDLLEKFTKPTLKK